MKKILLSVSLLTSLLAYQTAAQSSSFKIKDDYQTTDFEESRQIIVVEFKQKKQYDDFQKLKEMGAEYLGQINILKHCIAFPVNFDVNKLDIPDLISAKPYNQLVEFNNDTWQFSSLKRKKEAVITFFDVVSLKDINAILNYVELETVDSKRHSIRRSISLQQLEKLQELQSIQSVCMWEEEVFVAGGEDYKPSMNRSNYLSNGFNGLNFKGQQTTIGIQDVTDVSDLKIDFLNRVYGPKVSDVTNAHGNHVSYHLISAGNKNPYTVGVTPMADLYSMNNSISSLSTINDIVNNEGVRFINASYGTVINHDYNNTSSLFWDNVSWNNPSCMRVTISHNYRNNSNIKSYNSGLYNVQIDDFGSLGSPAAESKNGITVTAYRDDDTEYAKSSMGPSIDGRIKPDITSSGNSTSFSAPKLTAGLTQLYQAYIEENNGTEPELAMIKAIALNTADDIGNPGPDFKYGYGKFNAKRAYNVLHNNQVITGNIGHNGTNTHNLTIPANAKSVRVLLYWTDVPPMLTTQTNGSIILDVDQGHVALVNDLDLSVIDQSNLNQQIEPWVLNTNPNFADLNGDATRGADHLNNVEQVTQDNLALTFPNGQIEVKVTCSNLQMNLTQQAYYVVYEYLYDEAEITFPIGGEKLKPNTTEYIRFDAHGNTNTFDFELSTDNGQTWQPMGSTNTIKERIFKWDIPQSMNDNGYECKVRMKQTGSPVGTPFTDMSETFIVAPSPNNLTYRGICFVTASMSLSTGLPVGQYTMIDWSTRLNVDNYKVYKMGNKYMTEHGAFGDNFTGLYNEVSDWYAVSCVYLKTDASGQDYYIEGARSVAVERTHTNPFCPVLPASQPLGIESESYDDMLSLYPNPTEEIINVELNGGTIQTIEVHDLSGRLVFSISSAESTSIKIDLSTLSNGVYSIQVRDNQNQLHVRKLVKS